MHFVRMYNIMLLDMENYYFILFFCLQIKASAGFEKRVFNTLIGVFLIYIFLQLGYIILYLFSL